MVFYWTLRNLSPQKYQVRLSSNSVGMDYLFATHHFTNSIPRYQQFETQIRQMKVKKTNYQHSLDRAAVLNPDEDIDVHDSKLSKSVLDLDKKIQRLEKKQKAIGDSLKAIQSEVRKV